MNFKPEGLEFFDAVSGREMILVHSGPFKGWLCYRHPDGQWVTVRVASQVDISKICLAHDTNPDEANA